MADSEPDTLALCAKCGVEKPMSTVVTLGNVERVVADLSRLAQHDTPAVGALPTRTGNAVSALRWQWGLEDMSEADLRAARKFYAKRQHPDIILELGAREQAVGRMAVINAIVDGTLTEADPWQT